MRFGRSGWVAYMVAVILISILGGYTEYDDLFFFFPDELFL